MNAFIVAIGRGIRDTVVIWAIIAAFASTDPDLKRQLLSIFILGGVIGGGGLIYKLESCPLWFRAMCHAGMAGLTFLGIANWNNWFIFTPGTVIGSLVVFFILFFLIWTVIKETVYKN